MQEGLEISATERVKSNIKLCLKTRNTVLQEKFGSCLRFSNYAGKSFLKAGPATDYYVKKMPCFLLVDINLPGVYSGEIISKLHLNL